MVSSVRATAVRYSCLLGEFWFCILLCMNMLSRQRNLSCPQICNGMAMYSSIKCEMEEIENVAATVLYDLSQDNCAFTAPQLTVTQAIQSVILISRH